jgi:hypothetical protein
MKRNSSRFRAISFPAFPVRPRAGNTPLVLRFPSGSGQPGVGAEGIFVIKRVSRLPATNTQGKTIQRILIFDDHPASLRLVLGGRTGPRAGWTTPSSAKWWELLLAWMLIAGALLVVLVPFFLKLQT